MRCCTLCGCGCGDGAPDYTGILDHERAHGHSFSDPEKAEEANQPSVSVRGLTADSPSASKGAENPACDECGLPLCEEDCEKHHSGRNVHELVAQFRSDRDYLMGRLIKIRSTWDEYAAFIENHSDGYDEGERLWWEFVRQFDPEAYEEKLAALKKEGSA